MNRDIRRSLLFLAIGIALAATLSFFTKVPFAPASLIILVGWPLVGTLITADDDLPGGWSNPDGTIRPPWKYARFWADIVFRLGVVFAAVAISAKDERFVATVFWLLCVAALISSVVLFKRGVPPPNKTLNVMADLDIDKIAEIHRQIDAVLLRDWDPIGVSDVPEAADEYRGYVRGVYDVAVMTRSIRPVAKHLLRIERDRMGLSSRSVDALLPVAEKILDLVSEVGPLP